MTLTEAPFWVWGLMALNSSLFLLMSLTPLFREWFQKNQNGARKPDRLAAAVVTNERQTAANIPKDRTSWIN